MSFVIKQHNKRTIEFDSEFEAAVFVGRLAATATHFGGVYHAVTRWPEGWDDSTRVFVYPEGTDPLIDGIVTVSWRPQASLGGWVAD